jgi:Flp pilus assembly protein TadG
MADGTITRDRGSVDVSIEMLFGTVAVLMALLLVFETTAYWHARNVFEDAASDGVRIAAALDGSCADGVQVARATIEQHAGSWANDVEVTCVDAPLMVLTVSGRTPGVVGDAVGVLARVSQSAPRER